MTTIEFNQQCFDLFGQGWEYEVARRLGVQARSVRRWANGENPIPEGVASIIQFWQGSLR